VALQTQPEDIAGAHLVRAARRSLFLFGMHLARRKAGYRALEENVTNVAARRRLGRA
jgi:hypothetical protein